MHTLNLRDFKIKSNEEIPETIVKRCSEALNKNISFFNKRNKPFIIIITNNEKDFKKYSKKIYNVWLKGASFKGKKVVIRNFESLNKNFVRYGGTNNWDIVLIHEINHIFAYQLGLDKGPYWIPEGLAMYIAKQQPGKSFKPKMKYDQSRTKEHLFFRYRYDKLCIQMYTAQYFGIKYLMDRYGKTKLLNLFSKYHKHMKKEEFGKYFRNIYLLDYDQFLEDFTFYFNTKIFPKLNIFH